MPDFKALIDKVKDLAGKHPDQVHQGVEKTEDFAEKKVGNKYGDQIDKAGDAAEGYLGVHETEQKPE
jgi:MT0933-like antitoxin protein